MTPAQLATLKAAILAETDSALVALRTANDETGMANWYNADSTKICWKSKVNIDEIMRNGMDWARVDNLSVGKARIWDWMGRLGTIDPSKPNIRSGIDATWVGTSADLVVRAAVYVHCKRTATKAEALFTTGVGSDASPAVFDWEGFVNAQTVSDALRS